VSDSQRSTTLSRCLTVLPRASFWDRRAYVIAALARQASSVTALLAAGGLAAATGLYLLTNSPLQETR
jgi:hypothetical protein